MNSFFTLKSVIIFIVIYFIIYINQNYIFHQLVSKPKIYLWSKRNGNLEKFKEFQNNIDKFGNFENYVNSLETGKIHSFISPIFDKSLIMKKYSPNQFNPEIVSKEDSLPFIINMFTTPRTIFGNWIGDSIFRADIKNRGKNNKYKEYYMQGLMKEDLDQYRTLFSNYFDDYFKKGLEVPYFDYIQETNINLTYLIHFNEMPDKRDLDDTLLFIDVVRTYAFKQDYLDKQLFNLQQFYKRTMLIIEKTSGKDCLVGKWLKYGNFNKNEIFMEFIHNILGMAINWTNLMYSYILEYGKGSIPVIPDNPEYLKPYLYETIRFLNPVKFTTSKIKKPELFGEKKDSNCMLIHDLKLPTRLPELFGLETDKFKIERLTDYKKYTVRLDKVKLDTVKLGKVKLDTVKLDTVRLDTVRLDNKCPFSGFFESPKGAKVICGMELYEKEGYTCFGEGYRRCPGEHLTLILLEEMAKHFKHLEFEIIMKEGKSDNIPYVWGFVDKNLLIRI
jgi:hypothetical protein